MASEGPDAPETGVPLEREGQYTRLEELGRGGQSVVIRAYDEFITREVAIKELTVSKGSADSEAETPEVSRASALAARKRFLREARLVARLDHPGIVSVLELARRPDGTIFCSQKLIRGETLKQRLTRCSSLSERLQLLPHLIGASQAVAYAHSLQVVHRDLKPANVMVGPFGETIVVDWGLAKQQMEPDEAASREKPGMDPELTVAGTALGTPGYMSPEQARGELEAIDARSDVFSLGAILYELLTGRPPFVGSTPEHILENARRGRVHAVRTLAADAPPELAAVAERALRAQPVERYPNGEALAKELSAYLSGGRVGAYRYGTWELLRKFVSSHRALATGAALTLGFLLVAAAVGAIRLRQARLDLASAFLERAYSAEQDGDWSKAAAYFAAARAQHDTTEERWGLAVASEHIPTSIVSHHGPAGSFTDVGVLPDGRIIALGMGEKRLQVRDVESGATLWVHSGEGVLGFGLEQQGRRLVRLAYADRWEFRDGATGAVLKSWPLSWGVPCSGRFPPSASMLDGQLVWREEGGGTRVLAADIKTDLEGSCAVSEDGRQIAYVYKDWSVRLIEVEGGRELGRSRGELYERDLHFTPHGLVIFRQGRLEVIGGPDGDFTIDLPERRLGTGMLTGSAEAGDAVSPDGDLAVIASRKGATQAVVVDLRSRTMRGVLHYPPGWPNFAFSLDGKQVYAAGLSNASVVKGWRLPEEDMPRDARWWTAGINSRSGRSALLLDILSGRFEFYRPYAETLATNWAPGDDAERWREPRDISLGPPVASGVFSARPSKLQLVGDQPRVAFSMLDRATAGILDVATSRVIWQRPCPLCSELAVTDDGSRLALLGGDGLEVWDTRATRLVFRETQRVSRGENSIALSGDGRRLAWTFGEELLVRDLESQAELTLLLDGPIRGIAFDGDGTGLMTVTTHTATLRDSTTGQERWSGANDLPDLAFCQWTPDGRAVLLRHLYASTTVLDARSGERLARFQTLPPPVSPALAEQYLPNLRVKHVVALTGQARRPVPPPDPTPADESLSRTLQRTGLALRGVDLVAAP